MEKNGFIFAAISGAGSLPLSRLELVVSNANGIHTLVDEKSIAIACCVFCIPANYNVLHLLRKNHLA